MSSVDSTPMVPGGQRRTPELVKVTVYHNDEARFMPYEDGQLLVAVTCHWLEAPAGNDPAAIAEWAYHAFNADLDFLEPGRAAGGGETTFLAACVYRLLGYRSLSVGDVVLIETGQHSRWLACDSFGWRPIPEPSNVSGEPLTAAKIYQHLTNQRTTR
ncbi:hypothetical protein WEI85_00475 [Actinomycetes bacterium KLBMP 9797]